MAHHVDEAIAVVVKERDHDFLQPVAYVTPLFHGVELVRKIALPEVDASVVTSIPMWVHFAYLLTMVAVGLYLSTRLLDKRLRP